MGNSLLASAASRPRFSISFSKHHPPVPHDPVAPVFIPQRAFNIIFQLHPPAQSNGPTAFAIGVWAGFRGRLICLATTPISLALLRLVRQLRLPFGVSGRLNARKVVMLAPLSGPPFLAVRPRLSVPWGSLVSVSLCPQTTLRRQRYQLVLYSLVIGIPSCVVG